MRSFTAPEARQAPRFEGPTARPDTTTRVEVDRYRAEFHRLKKSSQQPVAGSQQGNPDHRPVAPPTAPEPIGEPGIVRDGATGRWRAEVDGRDLGSFDSFDLAVHARVVAREAIEVRLAERRARNQDTANGSRQLATAEREAILAYIEAMPGGVTPTQIRNFGPRVSGRAHDLVARIRAYFDELVESGELVTWLVTSGTGRSWWVYGRRNPDDPGGEGGRS